MKRLWTVFGVGLLIAGGCAAGVSNEKIAATDSSIRAAEELGAPQDSAGVAPSAARQGRERARAEVHQRGRYQARRGAAAMRARRTRSWRSRWRAKRRCRSRRSRRPTRPARFSSRAITSPRSFFSRSLMKRFIRTFIGTVAPFAFTLTLLVRRRLYAGGAARARRCAHRVSARQRGPRQRSEPRRAAQSQGGAGQGRGVVVGRSRVGADPRSVVRRAAQGAARRGDRRHGARQAPEGERRPIDQQSEHAIAKRTEGELTQTREQLAESERNAAQISRRSAPSTRRASTPTSAPPTRTPAPRRRRTRSPSWPRSKKRIAAWSSR